MRKKKGIFIVFSIMILFVLLGVLKREVKGAEIVYSGKSGDLDWTIDTEGCLTITGNGDYDYDGREDGYSVPKWCEYGEYHIKKAVIDVKGITDCYRMFYSCNVLQQIEVVNFDTSQVTDMSYMFCGCSNLTNLDASCLDVSQVTDMDGMFAGCSSLTNLDVSCFETLQVTNMSGMFQGCSNIGELDLSEFDTSQVTDMSSMFSGCDNLTELNVSGFDTSRVTDMTDMFGNCQNLEKLDVSGFNTSQVTSMARMFDGCLRLSEINVSEFDTGSVTTMARMFGNCQAVANLNVAKWNVSNVTDMYDLFFACTSLKGLSINKWNTSNVINMSGMFSNCKALTDIDFLRGLNVSSVTNMSGMFAYCDGLKKVDDLSFLDTSNVINMGGIFRNCVGLSYINLSGLNTSKVTDMSYMFDACSSLKDIEFGNFDTSQVTNLYGLVARCELLESLDMSEWDLRNLEEGCVFCWEAQGICQRSCSGMQEIHIPKNLNIPNGSMDFPITAKNEVWFDETGNVYPLHVGIPENIAESLILKKGLKMEPPVADVRGGNYSEAKTVSLTTSEEGADIYYTIDGSKPSRENGILYTGPISISEAVELQAIASKSGRPNSDVMSETYSFAISKETVNMDDLELGEDKAGKVEDEITQVFPADYELELALVPVKASCEVQVDGTYKVKVSIGIEREDLLDDETEWLRYKKCVKDLEDNSLSVNGMKTLLQKFDSKSLKIAKTTAFEVLPEVSALGFAEVQIDKNGNIIESDCKMQIDAKWEGSVVWPFVTPVGPVYLKLSGEAKVSGEGIPALEVLDAKAFSLQLKEGKVNVEPEISIEAGYGVDKVATLGAHGTASVDFQVFPASSAEFSGKAGIHAYIAFVFDEEYNFLTAKSVLWDTTDKASKSLNSNLKSTGLKVMDRAYADNTSSWNGDCLSVERSLNSEGNTENTDTVETNSVVLQTNIMPNTLPMIQRIGNENIMIFQTDVKERDDLNRTCLMYSVNSDGLWSDPEPIWDTGTNDLYADLQVVGNKLCVVWQKINDELDGNTENAYTDMQKKSDICFAMYNPDTRKFENAQYVVNDDQTDMMPKLAIGGDAITAVWVRNLADDFMQRSGKNQVVYKTLEGESFGEEKLLIEVDKQVEELTAFYEEGDLQVGLAMGSLSDTQLNDISVINVAGEETVVLSEAKSTSGIQYLDGIVYFWEQGAMRSYNRQTGELTKIQAGEQNILSNAQIYKSGDKTPISWSESNVDDGKAYVYSSVKTEEGFSDPVLIYEGKESIMYLDAVLLENGEWKLIMNTMNRNSEKEVHSLAFASRAEEPQIDVEMVEIDPIPQDNGEKISYLVTNTSEQVVNTIVVHYEDVNGVVKDFPVSTKINPGQSVQDSLTLELPEVADTTEATITIYAEKQRDLSDNAVPLTVRQTDIQLDTSMTTTEEEVNIAVTISNNSDIPSDAVVTLYGDMSQDEVLGETKLAEITKNGEERVYTFCVKKSDLKVTKDNTAYLPITVTSDKKDMNLDNNRTVKIVYDIDGGHIERGDINADGNVNLVDLMQCLNHVGGKEFLEGEALEAADINEDGTVNLVDLMRLLNYVGGKSGSI